MSDTLSYIQIGVSILLILSILLQQRGTALSQTFGGEGSVFTGRRGAEKWLFVVTIVLAFLFLGTAFLNLII